MAEFFYCMFFVARVIFTLIIVACNLVKYCLIFIFSILKKEILFIWNSRNNLPVFFYVFQGVLVWEILGFALFMRGKDFLLCIFLPKSIESVVFKEIAIPMRDMVYELYFSPIAVFNYQNFINGAEGNSAGLKLLYLIVLVLVTLFLVIILYHLIFLPLPAICGALAQVFTFILLAITGKRANANLTKLFSTKKGFTNKGFDSDGCKILSEEERARNIIFLEQMKQMHFSSGSESFISNTWPDGRIGGEVRYYSDGHIEALELPNGKSIRKQPDMTCSSEYQENISELHVSSPIGQQSIPINNVHKREIRDEYQRAITNTRKSIEDHIQTGYTVLKAKGSNLSLKKAINRCEENLEDFDEAIAEMSNVIWFSNDEDAVNNAYVNLKREIGKAKNANRDLYDLMKIVIEGKEA